MSDEWSLAPDSAPVEPFAPDAPVTREGGSGTGAPLDAVRDWLSSYICTMHERDLDLLTLWSAHTHLVHETYTTPRLVLDSPMPGSGKTTTLEHLERLCVWPIQAASLSSPALLARLLAAGMRTILVDEADRTLNPDKEGVSELLAILNSGYKRGGTRPVLTPGKGGEWNVSEMSTFAPVAMAGNNPQLPEDTRSRSLRVLLLPDVAGEVLESDWELIDNDARELGEWLAAWADRVRDTVRLERPPLPEGITGRLREKWSPLKRVAAAAGGRWPAAVDALAIHDKEQLEMDREDGMVRDRPAVVLLRHLFDLWPTGEAFWPTSEIIDELALVYPDMWGVSSPFGKPITAQRFGKMLATSYNVNSARMSRTGPRGYTRASLEPVWRRMGVLRADEPEPAPPLDVTGASGAPGSTGAGACEVRSHSPKFKAGRWTCPNCDAEHEAEAS